MLVVWQTPVNHERLAGPAVITFTDISHHSHSQGCAGTLPQWAGLSNLTVLSLMHNRLRGPLPDSFASLKQLQALGLAQNQLTGCVSPCLYPYMQLVPSCCATKQLCSPCVLHLMAPFLCLHGSAHNVMQLQLGTLGFDKVNMALAHLPLHSFHVCCCEGHCQRPGQRCRASWD